MTSRSTRPLSILVAGVLVCALAAPSSADDQLTPTPSPTASTSAEPSPTEPSPTEPPANDPSQTPTTTPSGAPTTTPVPAPPTITLVAPGPVRLDRKITLTATALDSQGQPLTERHVRFQRLAGTTRTGLPVAVTTADGKAVASILPTATSSRFRALLLATTGDTDPPVAESLPVDVTAYRAATRFTFTGPTSVIDERSVRLAVTLRSTDDSTPVPAPVTLQRRYGLGPWATVATTALVSGSGGFTVTPRVTTAYRVLAPAGAWWNAPLSTYVVVRNVPGGTVVRLPYGAPAPRWMAAQPRATTPGVSIKVAALTDAQWASMVGRSWHSGCPVGRSGLRSIEMNYWAFDGYRRHGRLVVNANAVWKYAVAFSRMYAVKVPIRRIYPSETFGWSSASHGANDYLAMQSDNTSAFNCRWVTGRPHVMSPHSTGYAVDINTFENPYRVSSRWLPNSWWPYRAFGLLAWRTSNAAVVQIMRGSGFSWTYGTRDSQHFDVRR